MGWLSGGWGYRKSHDISSATGAGVNYQIRIKVHYFNLKLSQVWDSGNIVTGTGTDGGRNQVIDGNYLYAVSNNPKKLVIYDISTPSAPVQKSLTSTTYGNIDVRKKDNYLFISCAVGIQIWDVTDVTAPSFVTTVNLDNSMVHGTFLLGNYLYCCQHLIDKFVIVDITDPESPVIKGSLSGATYFNGCHDVWVEGSYAYVANYLATTGQYGLTVVNISNPDAPVRVTSVGEAHKNSQPFKKGDYLYVGAHDPDKGMTVWDVSIPTSPSYVGRFFSEEGRHFAYWMDNYNTTSFVTICSPERKLYLIDVSTPTSPFIKTSVYVGGDAYPKNVVVNGNYFYVSWEDMDIFEWHLTSYLLETATDSGEDVYLDEKCRTDFGDVRFTNNDGTTLLDYWMESKSDSDNAVFWVEVADDLSTNPATIYIYYGKSDEVTTSNGGNTFIFFDDFEGQTVGQPPSGWLGDTTYFLISDVEAWRSLRGVKGESTATGSKSIYKEFTPQTGTFAIEIFMRCESAGKAGTFALKRVTVPQEVTWVGLRDTNEISYYDTTYHDFMTWLAGNWYRLKKTVNIGTDTYDIYVNDVLKVSGGNFRNVVSEISRVEIGTYLNTVDRFFDTIFIHKWQITEPAHGAWGEEEALSAGQGEGLVWIG